MPVYEDDANQTGAQCPLTAATSPSPIPAQHHPTPSSPIHARQQLLHLYICVKSFLHPPAVCVVLYIYIKSSLHPPAVLFVLYTFVKLSLHTAAVAVILHAYLDFPLGVCLSWSIIIHLGLHSGSQRQTNRSGISRDPPVSSSKPPSKRTTSSASENPKTKQQKYDEDEVKGTGKGQGRKGKKEEKKAPKGKKNRKTSAMRAEEDAKAGSPLKLTSDIDKDNNSHNTNNSSSNGDNGNMDDEDNSDNGPDSNGDSTKNDEDEDRDQHNSPKKTSGHHDDEDHIRDRIRDCETARDRDDKFNNLSGELDSMDSNPDPSTDITSNIANINIDEDIDANPREPDVEIPSLPHTPQCKGKARQMSSPQTPELQGASRVIGGVLHGCAHGNKANMADLIDADKDANDSREILGNVLLYLSNDNPATINPAETQLYLNKTFLDRKPYWRSEDCCNRR
ncbi:uncharacterized protein LACBIDRAFT_326655 [Laccaria bicolor S238N-H82]|uniref:Predicted protein n=1 Tax=Laccaria bicolor (strain S238N-H82 / ATCC MYA-4686) TaxID=486041 RepID=B0D9C9_LACBS|nr:uncharacterized protein LACBIDRAFT_326655 [Laccaria bicolor S238N-H82]EDR08995.1 predicted protein [Laccaria bicolor S238N-H82]|eukprot:XP_001880308.1 predicted protein [Laccaria bicolor S238N-H82]